MGSKQSIIDEHEKIYGTYRTHTMAMVWSITTEVVFLVFIAVAAYFAATVFQMYNITQECLDECSTMVMFRSPEIQTQVRCGSSRSKAR